MLKQKIIILLSESKEDEALIEKVDGETNIIEEIALDSLQMINFMLRVEEETGVEIDFDTFEFSNLSSVNSFVDYISERVNK